MLDLNDPDDAKRYIRRWIEAHELDLLNPDMPLDLTGGTEEDILRVARQLFLFCDTRPPAGHPGVEH